MANNTRIRANVAKKGVVKWTNMTHYALHIACACAYHPGAGAGRARASLRVYVHGTRRVGQNLWACSFDRERALVHQRSRMNSSGDSSVLLVDFSIDSDCSENSSVLLVDFDDSQASSILLVHFTPEKTSTSTPHIRFTPSLSSLQDLTSKFSVGGYSLACGSYSKEPGESVYKYVTQTFISCMLTKYDNL